MSATEAFLRTDRTPRAVTPAQMSRRALYVLWALFWLMMVVIEVQDHLHVDGILWWEPVLWETSSAAFATVWFALQAAADRRYGRYLDRPLVWLAHHLKWLPLMAATFIVLVYGVRHAIYAGVGATYDHEPWRFVILYETVKLALFVSLWLGIVFGFNSFAQWRIHHQRLLEVQKTLAESQLAQLRAQLQPHFLFNALNTISSLMHVDVARADQLLTKLGDLLRASQHAPDGELVSLREELHTLELYAQVMQERFADRVTLRWSIDPNALPAAVPAFVLQPLLENAFKHGVERSREQVRIEVSARLMADELHLIVHNSGSALDAQRHDGVGIRNCCERLNVIYGEAASLRLTQTLDGVEARIAIPWRGNA